MRLRFRFTRAAGRTGGAELAARAEDWLRGRADLLIAGMGGQVPVVVQLGVLAHADLGRLADLGHHSRLGSVRRAWGTEMARLAGDLAGLAGTPERLAALQRDLLVPLELRALTGRAGFSTRAGAIGYLRSQLPLPSPQDRPERSARFRSELAVRATHADFPVLADGPSPLAGGAAAQAASAQVHLAFDAAPARPTPGPLLEGQHDPAP